MKKCKIVALALSFIIFLTNMPSSVYGEEIISIKNFEDLQNISQNLAGNYRLENDITLNGEDYFYPIGDSSYFTGTFDGNGKKISNLNIKTIDETAECAYMGLFGRNKGRIFDLTLENVSVNIPSNDFVYFGAICGTLTKGDYDTSIENCKVTGELNISFEGSTTHRIGGLVGRHISGKISNSISSVNMIVNTEATSYIGGISGHSIGGEITKCGNIGNITIDTKNDSVYNFYIGGIVGYINNTPALTYCYNMGNLECSAKNLATGGIIGYSANANTAVLENCFNIGIIDAKSKNPGFISSFTAGNIYGAFTGTKKDNYYLSGSTDYKDGEGKTLKELISLKQSGKIYYAFDGDINTDGILSITDIVLLRKHILNKGNLSNMQLLVADQAENYGELTVSDIVALSDKIL